MIISNRVIWDRMVYKICNDFDNGIITSETVIKDLVRLGFEEDYVKEVINEQ